MTSSYSDLTKNVICLDLDSLTWESISRYAKENNLSEIGVDYLKSLYDRRKNERDKVFRVFIEGNFLLAVQEENRNLENLICSSFTEDVTFLKPVSLKPIEDQIRFRNSLRYAFLYKKLILDDTTQEFFQHQSDSINTRHLFDCTQDIINFDVSRLHVMTCSSIEKDYKFPICFHKEEEPLNKEQWYCKNIYFKNGLPIMFVFEGKGETVCGFHQDYIKAINSLSSKENIYHSKEEKLNAILDKINQSGIDDLRISEFEFLQNYSKEQ